MKEVWKDINGYEGCYQVSNLGRIKSLDRMTNNQYGEYFMKGRILKNSIIKDKGYCRVSLNNGNGKISKRVHRLVAEAFIPNPENKPEVNHKDGNKLNNCVSNLEWCTNKENIEHSIRTGLKNIVMDVLIVHPNSQKKILYLLEKIIKKETLCMVEWH